MERENQFTPDLYWCVQSFGKWYPEEANKMGEVLNFYLHFEQKADEIDSILEEFGGRIVKEFLKYMG